MNPLVTLITPVYNAMPYLRDYLASVAEQTWRPLEVLLVDDGSTDGSGACLGEMSSMLEASQINVQVFFRSHRGQAAAMNTALPHISGEYLTWCDADDLLTPDSVEKKVRFLLDHPEMGMVRSNGTVLDADGSVVVSDSAKAEDRHHQSVFEPLFMDRTYCYAGCYMVRTSLFFSCYPEKRIPESPEGQNLQMLLPPASRTICGYLDEKLHTYCRRHSGHSSQKRSYRDALGRIENFTALRLAILEYCDCDRAYYAQAAEEAEQESKYLLLRSAAKQARRDLKP